MFAGCVNGRWPILMSSNNNHSRSRMLVGPLTGRKLPRAKLTHKMDESDNAALQWRATWGRGAKLTLTYQGVEERKLGEAQGSVSSRALLGYFGRGEE